jgi:hypothetical protein
LEISFNLSLTWKEEFCLQLWLQDQLQEIIAIIHFIIGPHPSWNHLFWWSQPQCKLADFLRGDNKRGKVTENKWAILAQEYIKFAIQKCLI